MVSSAIFSMMVYVSEIKLVVLILIENTSKSLCCELLSDSNGARSKEARSKAEKGGYNAAKEAKGGGAVPC